MNNRKLAACLVIMGMLPGAVWGQDKLAKEAATAYKDGFYYNAIELYKKAYVGEDRAALKAELIYKIGECYRTLGDPAQCEVWFVKANKAGYNDPVTYLYIGDALMEQGKYTEAIDMYNRYKEKKPNDMRADAAITAAQQAKQWEENPTRYVVAPEVLLNTPNYDFSPTYADKNNNDLVFTSSRPAATGTEPDLIWGDAFSDLFTSRRDKLGKWSEPVKLPPTINTMSNEGAAALNSGRNLMYFTRCVYEKKKVHGCNIWVSKKVGSDFAAPVELALKPEQAKDDTFVITIGHPAIVPGDGAMVFSSNMLGNGAQGGTDLWVVKLNPEGMPVGKPVNLGPEINTKKDEKFPHIRANGNLYFASNGRPGMGGLDIFMAEKTGDNQWGHAENMKSPVNSAGDDFGMIFDAEEDRGYFTTNRPGGKGMDDIWAFYMPSMVFALQGTVYDKLTGQPLPGAKVEVVGTDGQNISVETDENGSFAFVEKEEGRYINENTSYTIRATADKYLAVKDQITTVGLKESTTFVKEYLLMPTVREIPLPQVLYPLDDYQLTEQAKDSLETLYQIMVENPTIVIELRSHTDSRKTSKYKGGNLELSQKRAQSCVNYLATKGIDLARMKPVGRGAEEPLITDAEIAKMATKEEKEAAHAKNRRTDFKVLSWDYVPQQNAPPPNN